MNHFESGYLQNEYAFIRLGNAKEKIVVFPPLNDDLFDLKDFSGHLNYLFSYLSRDYSVYVISRKKELPVGYLTREMAADYAKLFETIGPAYVMGISLGGMIAQYFAKDYPQYVKKLILVASAYQMGPEGLRIARRWIPWARENKWKKTYDDMIDISFTGWRGFIGRWLKRFFVPFFQSKIKYPANFILAGEAGILHDSYDILPSLKMPVLMIAGTRDPFFPENLFREMVRRIPHSTVCFFKGARHGVFEENLKDCSRLILSWFKKVPLPEIPNTTIHRHGDD